MIPLRVGKGQTFGVAGVGCIGATNHHHCAGVPKVVLSPAQPMLAEVRFQGWEFSASQPVHGGSC